MCQPAAYSCLQQKILFQQICAGLYLCLLSAEVEYCGPGICEQGEDSAGQWTEEGPSGGSALPTEQRVSEEWRAIEKNNRERASNQNGALITMVLLVQQ